MNGKLKTHLLWRGWGRFSLFCFAVSTALRGKKLIDAINDDQVKVCSEEKALPIIVPVLGDHPLGEVQEREKAKKAGKMTRKIRWKTLIWKWMILQK